MDDTIQSASVAFRSRREQTHYWLLFTLLTILAILFTIGLIVYNNPVAIDSPSFLPVVRRRFNAVITMLIVAVCQGLATVAFQSISQNRIITPSLLGFEALYTSIQTATVYFFGLSALINFSGNTAFIIQMSLMVGCSILLYGYMLKDIADLQLILLVGVVLGSGLKSVSAFMRTLLEPAEFDVLQARLFGSVNNANPDSFPLAIGLVLIASVLLFFYANHLNLLTLGSDISTNLGANPRYSTIFVLFIVSVLMSVSTALLGSISFLGFLAATLTYQSVSTFDHRYLFPMVILFSYLILTASYFFMYHIFNAQGVVTLIIELFGGVAFLLVLLKRGKS